MKISQLPAEKTRSRKATTTVSRRSGVAALAALAVIFCSGATSPSGCNSSSDSIGPSGGQVAGAAIGIGAVVAVAIIVPIEINHSHHRLKGCVFNGPSGFELRTSNGKTYGLEGDPSSIKAGDMVQFHGSKVKKTKDSNGNEVFRVEKIKKEYGPCKVDQVASRSTP